MAQSGASGAVYRPPMCASRVDALETAPLCATVPLDVPLIGVLPLGFARWPCVSGAFDRGQYGVAWLAAAVGRAVALGDRAELARIEVADLVADE